ncbi:Protein STRUBBELIG-REPTOR FAMILY 2 [Castilleja foliolosa]|uniref:Protein STRUBBELIG-REPTOR FAMILY 2 n=1 Tax=Castilleja foliolosa TaxID=1961234 RepID=A0ABD3BS32_9LAMI
MRSLPIGKVHGLQLATNSFCEDNLIGDALDYVHSSFVPPVAHSNLKAANILLNEDLMPHVYDCGLASLRLLPATQLRSRFY